MSAVLKQPTSLETLTAQWLEAKRVEIAAVAARREIDTQIVALMPKKDEGSVSKNVGFLKVSVTYGVSRKVDGEKLDAEWEALSDTVRAAFRKTWDVAAKEYKALSGADLDSAVAFVESKPSSPIVKIEVIDAAKT